MDRTEQTQVEAAVRKYSAMLLRVAYSRLSSTSDAEDVVQEAFLRFVQHAPRLKNEEHTRAWLIRVTHNLACDAARARSRRPSAMDAQAESIAAPDAFAQRETSETVLNAVRTLPPKYSAVVHHHYYEGLTLAEIAHVLRIRPATAGTRLARARTLLKGILEEDL